MKLIATLFWVAGWTLLIALLAYQGFPEMVAAVSAAGWGLLVVTTFYIVPMAADTMCWKILLPRQSTPRLFTLMWTRWICSAINNLLPVAQVGGDLVRTRLIAVRGVPGPEAGASVVTDITIGVATQILFSVMGIILMFQFDTVGNTALAATVGTLLFSLLLLGFYLAQRYGLFLKLTHILERMIKVGDWKNIVGGAQSLDRAILSTYRRRGALIQAGAWRLFGWIGGTGEVWLALYFLGHPVTLVEAFMLESLGQAVRNAAFMIPGALGVQEGGFILLGAVVGLTPDTGLALSLVKRVRELSLGLPALLVWQIQVGKRLLRRSPEAYSASRN